MDEEKINQHNEEEHGGNGQEKDDALNTGGDNGEERHEENAPFKMIHLSGMYKNWFLDYASYVILERAVPHINDGLKPVQRRILHAMKRIDDSRYNKVANIIGYTMQYHPHGDASIQDALVQLGQKNLLIDTQGNWGNIFTGDSAAAPRYIEARLTRFAQEVVFFPKITEWKVSYDGRNEEPVTLPLKFPLLLAQGVEGIAVGLASKILPHNFNEIIDAAIAYLKDQEFELYPDFVTAGMADFSRYNNGLRGGSIRVRARISKVDKNTLAITEIPFGKTTNSLIDTIIKANDKGKIKVKRIDDNTAEHVEIQVHLANGVSIDKTIDALYAFTDCEISISPNACVIENEKPRFLGVNEILKISVDHTLNLLTKELEIKRGELEEDWHMSSLEKIFIENKIYNDIEDCETWEAILETIDKGLDPFKKQLKREVTQDDIVKLTELKIKKISKYDIKKADEYIKNIEEHIEDINHKLANIVPYTIEWYKNLKKKYGKGRERKTEIRNFHNIEATKVVESNKKLFVNRKEGFIGTSLRKDEYVCDCSDIDDIIVFLKDGRYYITKVDDKVFVGKNIIHVRVFKKNDQRTIYNIIYRDGFKGNIRVKRTAITGAMRDKEYNLTKGTEGSQVLYMTVNPNGEAETVTVYHVPRPRLKNRIFDFDFGEMEIKGKNSMGNILTKYPIHKIVLKEKGQSTLGGRHRWFDFEVLRLNSDENGQYLGEFFEGDKVLVVTNKGTYNLTSYDITNHYEDNIIKIEKYDPEKVFSVVYYDGEQDYYYVKRFKPEPTDNEFSFIGEHPKSKLTLFTENQHPVIKIHYGGSVKKKEDIVNIDEFIAVKGIKAHGKRLTTNKVKKINELEPLKKGEQPVETEMPQKKQEKQTPPPKEQKEEPPASEQKENKKNQNPADGNSQMFFDW